MTRMPNFQYTPNPLPEDQKIWQPSANYLSYAYGSVHAAARYCGFEEPPYVPLGQWQHGWIRPDCLVDPVYVVWDGGRADAGEYQWVGRKELEDYLRAHGYPYAHAIGVGMVYVEPIEVPRLPNSLLVMPRHSIYSDESFNWDYDSYLQEILAIKDDFDYVAVSIHPACQKHGLWMKEFQNAGIEIVTGADFESKYGLYRMKWLMNRFEYVTTNFTGTNIAYATYCGAKMSLYGTYIEPTESEAAGKSEVKRKPELKEKWMFLNSDRNMRDQYPFLFVEHPKEAKAMPEWGAHQLGEDQKRSPSELCDLFGWPHKKVFTSLHKNPEFYGEVQQCSLSSPTPPKAFFANAPKNPAEQRLEIRECFKAAQAQDPHACYALALLFELQGYANPDADAKAYLLRESYQWARRAAEKGHPEAQLFCITMLAEGLFVEKDLEEARAFVKILINNPESTKPDVLKQLKML